MKTNNKYLVIVGMSTVILIAGSLYYFMFRKKVKEGKATIIYTGQKKSTGVTGIYFESGKSYEANIKKDGSALIEFSGSYGPVPVTLNSNEFKLKT